MGVATSGEKHAEIYRLLWPPNDTEQINQVVLIKGPLRDITYSSFVESARNFITVIRMWANDAQTLM